MIERLEDTKIKKRKREIERESDREKDEKHLNITRIQTNRQRLKANFNNFSTSNKNEYIREEFSREYRQGIIEKKKNKIE